MPPLVSAKEQLVPRVVGKAGLARVGAVVQKELDDLRVARAHGQVDGKLVPELGVHQAPVLRHERLGLRQVVRGTRLERLTCMPSKTFALAVCGWLLVSTPFVSAQSPGGSSELLQSVARADVDALRRQLNEQQDQVREQAAQLAALSREIAALRERLDQPPARVLVMFSGHRLVPAALAAEQELRAALDAGSPRPVEYYYESVDEFRHPGLRYESAFVAYLAAKYGEAAGLWPKSQDDRSRAVQWSIWAMTELEPPAMRVLRNRAFLPEAQRVESEAKAGEEDLKALPLRLGEELVRLTRAWIFGVLAGHLDVAAERNGTDAVLGVAALDLQDFRPEAQGERQDTNTMPSGREKVSQLMDEDQDAEHEEERQ